MNDDQICILGFTIPLPVHFSAITLGKMRKQSIPINVLQSIRELAFNRSPLNPDDLIIPLQLCVKEDYNPNPSYAFTSVAVISRKTQSNCDTVINLSDINLIAIGKNVSPDSFTVCKLFISACPSQYRSSRKHHILMLMRHSLDIRTQ